MALRKPEREEDEQPKIGLTIYLLKPEMVTNFEKLKEGRTVLQLALPLDGEFVVFPPSANEPAWVDTVRSALKEPTALNTLNAQSPSGLLIVKREENTFIVSFGHAWQKLDDPWLEPDFGLRVALNSIPPNKIVEIRAEQVFANWHMASERAPRATFLHDFGVEFDRDLVATFNGIPSNTPILGDHLRSGTNLHIKTSFSKLGDILDKTATLFRSNAYKKRWPEIANVKTVRDPSVIEKLDQRLDSEFQSGEAKKKLVLFTPVHRQTENLDLAHSYVYGRLSSNPTSSPYLMVGSWLNYLESKEKIPSTSEAKETRIHFLDEAKEEIKNYRIYDCFGYELSYNARPHILSSGIWYEVNADFLERINKYVTSQIKEPPVTLPKWNKQEDESAYNIRCGNLASFLHFDCKNVMFGGGQSKFEFCDFLDTKTKTLFFAKNASKSSSMSHLVEQVRRTAELLFDPDQTYRDKLSDLFKAKHPTAERSWLKTRPKNWDWKLCLVSLDRAAEDLPFFAKCALWRLHKNLISRGHEVYFVSV